MDEKTNPTSEASEVQSDSEIIFELNRKLAETTKGSLGEIAKRNNEIERRLYEISPEVTVTVYTPMVHRFGTTYDGTNWIAFYNEMGLSKIGIIY